jgi:hypothetical protein
MRIRTTAFATALLVAGAAAPGASAEAAGEAPQFVGLADGQNVTSPLTIRFTTPGAVMTGHDVSGMQGMAGTHAAGHVHLVIDAPTPKPGESVPSDGRHRHLMHGEQKTILQLKPGDHTLQLVLAGADHRVATPVIASERITIHVTPSPARPAS